jgi:hypothetical protein
MGTTLIVIGSHIWYIDKFVNAGFCSQPPLHILAGLYLWMLDLILIIAHIVYGFLVNATFALAESYDMSSLPLDY